MPGYHGILPRVFPFRRSCAIETADVIVNTLMREGLTGFAVTSHPSTLDGHVDVWLSTEAAQFLVEVGVLFESELEAT